VAFNVFIASSRKHIALARAIQSNLDDDQLHTTIWDQDVFKPSQYPLDALAAALDESDFGIFVLAPDDLARVGDKETMVPRDNVVFELGFFAGRLGYNRTFAVAPKDLGYVHLPSDLAGLTLAMYDSARAQVNAVAALGKACNKIRLAITDSLASDASWNFASSDV
jgi:predicted nucleotide-binding protein